MSADSSVALVGQYNDNGGVGRDVGVRATARALGLEQKLVGAGATRKGGSSVPPAADAALMGRSEDRGRVGAAADSQDGGSLYPDPMEQLLPDGLSNRARCCAQSLR